MLPPISRALFDSVPYSGYISRGESFAIRPFCLFRGEIIRGLDLKKKKKNLPVSKPAGYARARTLS